MNERKRGRIVRTDRMPICTIIPPHTLENIAANASGPSADAARKTLFDSARLHGNRQVFSLIMNLNPSPGGRNRMTYDAMSYTRLPGLLKIKEGEPPTGPADVDTAHALAGEVYDFFRRVFDRDSLDGRGMPITSTANYGDHFCNGYWNGRQMVYGRGDGRLFGSFACSRSVSGHEFTHGLIQSTANLNYEGESGALNEHVADVFGAVIEQFAGAVPVNQADWVIGRGLFLPSVKGDGVRNLLRPGTAYDDPILGHDPQPDRMSRYVRTNQDNGGVHVNSGIPNRAFALAAIAMGGNSWDRAAPIWFRALTRYLVNTSGFVDLANGTIRSAQDLFGPQCPEADALRMAWDAVEIRPTI